MLSHLGLEVGRVIPPPEPDPNFFFGLRVGLRPEIFYKTQARARVRPEPDWVSPQSTPLAAAACFVVGQNWRSEMEAAGIESSDLAVEDEARRILLDRTAEKIARKQAEW